MLHGTLHCCWNAVWFGDVCRRGEFLIFPQVPCCCTEICSGAIWLPEHTEHTTSVGIHWFCEGSFKNFDMFYVFNIECTCRADVVHVSLKQLDLLPYGHSMASNADTAMSSAKAAVESLSFSDERKDSCLQFRNEQEQIEKANGLLKYWYIGREWNNIEHSFHRILIPTAKGRQNISTVWLYDVLYIPYIYIYLESASYFIFHLTYGCGSKCKAPIHTLGDT